MPRYTRDSIEKLRECVPIEYIVGAYTVLRYGGPNRLVGKCSFHNERTGSFFVRPNMNTFHCFGCGMSGDVFHFIMEMRGLRFDKAVQYVARAAQLESILIRER